MGIAWEMGQCNATARHTKAFGSAPSRCLRMGRECGVSRGFAGHLGQTCQHPLCLLTRSEDDLFSVLTGGSTLPTDWSVWELDSGTRVGTDFMPSRG